MIDTSTAPPAKPDAALAVFSDFMKAVAHRLGRGEEVYRNRSFELPPAELAREISEELLDVAGWSFIAWCRLERARRASERLEEPAQP